MRRPIRFGPLGGHGFIHDPHNINAGPTAAHLGEALRMKAAKMAAAARRGEMPVKPREKKQLKKGASDEQ